MTKPKLGKIQIGVYDTTIHIVLVPKDIDVVPQVQKILKKHRTTLEEVGDDDGSTCNGYAILIEKDPLNGYLVYSAENLSVNLITHETDHMRKYILDFKDIDDYEASANLNAYINQEVFRFIKKAGFEIIY